MLDRDAYEAIVTRLYAAASGDMPWHSALEVTTRHFGQSASVLAVYNAGDAGVRAESYGRSSDFTNSFYASEIFAQDPRSRHYMAVAPGRIYFDHCLYDVSVMERDERVRATIDAIGVKYQLGATLRLTGGATGVLSLLSTAAEGHASEAAIASLRRLAPHIEQACAIGELVERSATTQHALIEALAARADGIMLLDRTGAPVFLNDVASAILGAGDGLCWSPDGFRTRRAAETRRLNHMVGKMLASPDDAGRAPGGQMLVTRPSGLLPYVVRVLAAPSTERFLSSHSSVAMIHIHDLARVRIPSHGLLRATFGLTRREADLAVELVRHAGLASAAAGAGMAINTARNHLQVIFRKCGVATQAEAVQLFGRLA